MATYTVDANNVLRDGNGNIVPRDVTNPAYQAFMCASASRTAPNGGFTPVVIINSSPSNNPQTTGHGNGKSNGK